MNADPVLRTYAEGRGKVYGGLHYLKGNSSPYFTLTYWYKRGSDEHGGAGHEEILKHFPDLADLAALHLSDIDGVPMHADGFYFLAGALPDGFGERYHVGNSDRNFPDGYRKPTGDDCLQFFANHCRISLAEARAIRDDVQRTALAAEHSRNAAAKARLAEIMATMRPRWKAEAEACIVKHGLVVYGDKWPVEA